MSITLNVNRKLNIENLFVDNVVQNQTAQKIHPGKLPQKTSYFWPKITLSARWQPATREEWAYPDSPYPTQAPAYQAAPADNYQAPAANYQAPADNYQAPPAAQESYTAPAYKK